METKPRCADAEGTVQDLNKQGLHNEFSAKTVPKSALGKALHYLRDLVRYLEDGRLELSNDRAERRCTRRTGSFPTPRPVLSPAL